MLERDFSGIFHTWITSTYCVPSPTPVSEIGHNSGSISKPSKPTGCWGEGRAPPDRKSTRLNSSHANISYAVFCLKKKNYLSLVIYSIYLTHHYSISIIIY